MGLGGNPARATAQSAPLPVPRNRIAAANSDGTLAADTITAVR
jgi:hypothetical protein